MTQTDKIGFKDLTTGLKAVIITAIIAGGFFILYMLLIILSFMLL